jgi:hypothetical protein
MDIDLSEAMSLPMASSPQPGTGQCQDLLEEWETDFPQTKAELEQRLQAFMDLVQADPDNACAQLGLVIAILAVGTHNGANYLGYDLFPGAGTASVARGFADGPCGSDVVLKQSLHLALGEPAKPSVQPSSRGEIPGTTLTTEQVQAAIEQLVLPGLANCIERLDALISGAPSGDFVLATVELDGSLVNLYRADMNAITATIQLLRGFLLQLVAYNLNPEGYDWEEPLPDKDDDSNGILTVSEHAPPDPFLTLRSGSSMTAAGVALRDAVQRARAALEFREPDSLLDALLPGDTSDVEENLADVDEMLSGQVTATAHYNPTGGSTNVEIDMSSLWSDPIEDLKDLLPQLHIDLTSGGYSITVGATDFPDKSFDGLFPDGGVLIDVLTADHDVVVLEYESIEIQLIPL